MSLRNLMWTSDDVQGSPSRGLLWREGDVEMKRATKLPPASEAAAKLEPELEQKLLRAWDAHRADVDLDLLESAIAAGNEDLIIRLLNPDALNLSQTSVVRPMLERGARTGAAIGATPLRAAGIQVRDGDDR